jgi:multiple sugar transport system permease protein
LLAKDKWFSGGYRMSRSKNNNVVRYNRWGYIFLIPFMVVFIIFQLIPLCSTIYNSFFEHYFDGIIEVGPKFVGLANYKSLFSGGDVWKYLGNTLIMWIAGFIPQILVSLLLANWFSSPSLRLKGKPFFQTVIYLPNLIMASAFAMLFFALFSNVGPVNGMLTGMGILKESYDFFSHKGSARALVAFMNFLMWFGNTTILLLAGMLGIDTSLYEAAEVDGATSNQVFFRITLPILRPILVYVMITSLIGGLQMFDVPQIMTDGSGEPTRTTMTLIMYLNKHLYSKNYGMGGALSVFLFVVTGILSLIIFRFNSKGDN